MKSTQKIQQLLSLDTKIIIQKLFGILIKPIYTKIHNENKFIKPYLEKKLNYTINYDEINFPENAFFINKYEESDISNILQHKFDLLGSNLTQVSYSNTYPGFEGYKYDFPFEYTSTNELVDRFVNDEFKNSSKQILNNLTKEYKLIDWFIDFKSGYRWDSQLNHKNIKIGDILGSDIKVPWELSRLQHLHILADYFLKNRYKVEILEEIQNQLLDFIALNPPFYGLNWKSPMEVSIRSFNIILLIILLRKNKIYFERPIQSIIDDYLFLSLKFIENNNEWNSGLRNNHYFVNLLGLLSLKLVFQEKLNNIKSQITAEVLAQFNEDGSNFEGSIPYHFFTFEALQWMLIILPEMYLYLSTHNDVYNRLSKIFQFSNHFNNNYNNLLQIGDNDSGIITNYHNNIINHRFNKDLYSYSDNNFEILSKDSYKYNIFRDIGIILIDNQKINFAISLGRNSQFGKGGHNHNDKFSFVMNYKNYPIFVDPGSYTYTAIPELRNQYRSARMHNTMYYERIAKYSLNKSSLFWLKDYSVEYKFNSSDDECKIKLFDKKRKQSRIFDVSESNILITDEIFTNRDNAELNFYFHPSIQIKKINDNLVEIQKNELKIHFISDEIIEVTDYYYSHSYGSKVIAKSINIKLSKNVNKNITKIVFD